MSEIRAVDGIIDFTSESNSECIGVDFRNCNNCSVSIGQIYNFNTGFRFFGDGFGCCYNDVTIGLILNFNYGVRFYQDKTDDPMSGDRSIGWCNENTLNGIRFSEYSSFDPENEYEKFPILFRGPLTASDTYDKCNSISINDCSAENFDIAIYARNVSYMNINRLRCENTRLVAKFVGNGYGNSFLDSGFDYNGARINLGAFDISEATRFPFSELSTFRLNTEQFKLSTKEERIAVDGFAAYQITSGGNPTRRAFLSVAGTSYYGGIIVDVGSVTISLFIIPSKGMMMKRDEILAFAVTILSFTDPTSTIMPP